MLTRRSETRELRRAAPCCAVLRRAALGRACCALLRPKDFKVLN